MSEKEYPDPILKTIYVRQPASKEWFPVKYMCSCAHDEKHCNACVTLMAIVFAQVTQIQQEESELDSPREKK
jgi:hypothetical protein